MDSTPKSGKQGKKSFLTQLLVLRFISKLRHVANNINIHSIKQEHLEYINDPTLIRSSYAYHGNGLRQLIKLHTYKTKTIFTKIYKKCRRFLFQALDKIKLWSVLHPNYILGFDIFISMITVEQFFLIALSITFGIDVSIKINVICYVFMGLDMVLKISLKQPDNLALIKNKRIFSRINLEFIVSFVSLLPQILYWVIDSVIVNYCRVLFYYRVYNISTVFNRLEYKMSDFKQNFLQLFKLYFTLITVAHIIGCFWYALGREETINWIETYFKGNNLSEDELSLYITSIYWSITTMLTVGYGDVLPVNYKEKLYAIATMLIGCCLFGYIMNSIGGIFDHINNNAKALRQEMQKLNNFLDSKNIDEKLKSKFRKYLEHYHLKQQSHILMNRQNLENISDELMLEFNHQILKHLRKKNFLLSQFESPVIQALSKILEEKNYLPDELIYEKTSENFYLYMILSGSVIEVFQRNSLEDIETYKSLQCFGEVDFISGQRMQCLFISQHFTNTFAMERESFIQIVKDSNFFDYVKFCFVKDLLIYNKDYKYFDRVCPACFKKDHLLYTCPQIHYYPNVYRMIFQKTDQQRSNDHLRKSSKSKNTLAYLQDIQSEAVVFLDDNQSYLGLKSDEAISDKPSEESVDLSEVFKSEQYILEQEEPVSQDDSPFPRQFNRSANNKKTIFELTDIRDKVQGNLNQEVLNQYRQQRERKIQNNKFATNTNIEAKEPFFQLNDFDKEQQYTHYFPYSNKDQVIEQLRKKQKQNY